MKLKELLEKRARLMAEARKFHDDHSNEWTEERQASWDAMLADVDKVTAEVRRLEALEALEAEQRAAAAVTDGRTVTPEPTAPAGEVRAVTSTPEYRAAFDQFLRTGSPAELRAMSVSSDPAGGYLVPNEFQNTVVLRLAEYVPMRQYATVIQASGDAEIPVDTATGAAYWTDEAGAYTPADETLGLVTLGGHKLTRLCQVSEELVQDAAFGIDNYLATKFATAFAAAEELAFTTGSGTGRPKGFTLDATTGVTAALDDTIDPDEIMDLFFSVKAPYRRRGVWQMADSTLSKVAQMVDGDGRYIWQLSMAPGTPDTLLGRPIVPNNSMATVAADALAIAFGDFSYYWIVDRGQAIVQRLTELYAANGQVGFRMARRVDGQLTQAEAVKVLKMGPAGS